MSCGPAYSYGHYIRKAIQYALTELGLLLRRHDRIFKCICEKAGGHWPIPSRKDEMIFFGTLNDSDDALFRFDAGAM